MTGTPSEDRPGDAENPESPRRPRDLALLLLAAEVRPPRARARDQQADLAGSVLRREILDRIAARDPEPDGLDIALTSIVAELGEPNGPTRALCAAFRDEWEAGRSSPGFWGWLLAEAVQASRPAELGEPSRRRRHAP